MSYIGIKNAIKTKLQGITAIKEVWEFPVDIFKGMVKEWPIGIIVESGNENDYLTNKENMRVYAYEVWLVRRIDNANMQTEWDNQRTLMDSVLDTFDAEANATLGGVVDNVEPVPGTFEVRGFSAEQSVIISYVMLKCMKVKAI